MTNDEHKDMINKLLKGRTMSVYALLLTNEGLGVREVQRKLGFSTPSLALHHLTKLQELELIDKNVHGEYFIKKHVKAGSLSLFVRLGKHLLPRFLFLLTFLSFMLIVYSLFFLSWPITGNDLMFIMLCVITIGVVLYESVKIWNLSPF